MDTKLTKIKYSKILKAALVILLAALSFLNAQRMILIAKAATLYDIPNVNELESTNAFYDQIYGDISKISYYALYGGGEVTRDSFAYAKAHEEVVSAYKTVRDELLAIYDDLMWLKEHQPTLFYIEEYDAYFAKEQYDIYNRNFYSDDYFENTDMPTTSEGIEGESYIDDEIAEETSTDTDNTTQATADYSAVTEAPGSNSINKSGATPEERYPNWRYNDKRDNYIYSLESDYYSKSYSTDHPDPYEATREQIIAYYDKQIASIDKNDAFWQNYRRNAENYIEDVGKFENLKFAVLDKETGVFYSNFAPSNADGNSIREEIKNFKWHLMFSSESGTEGTGVQFEEYPNYVGSVYPYWMINVAQITSIHSFLFSTFGENNFNLYLYLPDEIVGADEYARMSAEFKALSDSFEENIISCLIGFAFMAAILICLIVIAGRNTAGELVLLTTDRAYHDLHFIASGLVSGGLVAGAAAIIISYYYEYSNYSSLFLSESHIIKITAAMFALGVLVLAELLISISRNIKSRNLIKHTLIYKLLYIPKWLFRKVRSLYRKLKKLMSGAVESKMENLKQVYLLYAVAFVCLNFILFCCFGIILATEGGTAVLFFFFIAAVDAVVILMLLKSIKALDKIMGIAGDIRKGNLNSFINLNDIPAVLQPLARNVIENQEGLRNAVDSAVREERTRAELITNVSHDLKTPLTSIVSYVSLLKQCDIKNPDALQYVEVLDEKADRLKRLIEDLVEASKVSAGNIKLNLVHVNLQEITVQAMGENSDALEEEGIEMRMSAVSEPVVISADSQRTWRVIDNLFTNVKKYTMPNTRVYIDVRCENGYGVFEMKNISRNPLNMPVEELTQRFVRGDEARGGDGSGLGLSIAKSLCELQGGTFDIDIDGDLFKATIKLPLAQ